MAKVKFFQKKVKGQGHRVKIFGTNWNILP